ncbi:HIT domain-containing protein [Epidermidibacterium keratini]|uniref:HIT domain-containing protein n=1 Tax=Epidermidibacterium keratini TaxID=1891644 RepID=A0A7L4YQ74_9ACTN|nr:HIT family protein [Epidermidibacterium keratini]QHC01172.1 HIT domain-containing protein [Epidermidibacterium keratini]
MSSIFTKIIDGSAPARFVYADDLCVAFLDIAPLSDGHTLVVPREPVDHWLDADDELMAHLWKVTGLIGHAQKAAFTSRRIGVIVAGYEVPHLHIHTFPSMSMSDFSFYSKDHRPDPRRLDANADALRAALGEHAYAGS